MRDPTSSIAWFDFSGANPALESWGLRLANAVGRTLRDVVPPNKAMGPSPIGPGFDYGANKILFLGRRGVGPLHVAWDTNLLIDYFVHGHALWNLEPVPEELPEDYRAELEGLQLVMGLWVMRDLRFHLLPQVIHDARGRLSTDELSRRKGAFDEFSSALRLVGSGDPSVDRPSREGLLVLPERALQRALATLPAGHDRLLVGDAVRAGVHVYLTRDKAVLRRAPQLTPFGLRLASPLDLLEALIGGGSFHCLLAPQHASWPLPDQQRVAHLVRALHRSTADL